MERGIKTSLQSAISFPIFTRKEQARHHWEKGLIKLAKSPMLPAIFCPPLPPFLGSQMAQMIIPQHSFLAATGTRKWEVNNGELVSLGEGGLEKTGSCIN